MEASPPISLKISWTPTPSGSDSVPTVHFPPCSIGPSILPEDCSYIQGLVQLYDEFDTLISKKPSDPKIRVKDTAKENPKPNKHRNGKVDAGQLNQNPDSKIFKCPYCGFGFNYQHARNRHVRSIHEKHLFDSFNCDQCNYTTVRRDQMRTHYRVIHEQYYPFRCSICAYGAVKATKISEHILDCHKGNGEVTRLKRAPSREKNLDSLKVPNPERLVLGAVDDGIVVQMHEDGAFDLVKVGEMKRPRANPIFKRTPSPPRIPTSKDEGEAFGDELIQEAVLKCYEKWDLCHIDQTIQDVVEKVCQRYKDEIKMLKQSHESLIEYATHYRNAYLDSQVNAKTVIQPEVMPEGIIHHVQNDSNSKNEDEALQGVPCKFIALEHLKSESDSDDNL